ncbi:HTTM domain-containing protein [uncultured Croceitalea sp.]|uniref:HTTM domain-containing protein n=1 Tax=uncultured Croceitalea sp. TaxID=1798908 RepID=UPI0033057752
MSKVGTYLNKSIEAAPLAVFRILFGLMMFTSIVRFWSYGWIEKLYLTPDFHFSYYGFEWVKPIGNWTYLLFAICGIAALAVAVGFKYRLAIITFFISFTYIELMDKTTYLNHYYFISLLSFLLIFLPANAYYSIDARQNEKKRFQRIPQWNVDAVKLLLALVYIYAGLAKLNSDWLVDAMPLKIWLPSKFDIPLIGDVLGKEWVHYTFSWVGAGYDLFIPFLLLYRPTRWFAFGLVVVFHVLTRVLFPIGMFPYIMIVSALIFFDSGLHHKVLGTLSKWLKINKNIFDNNVALLPNKTVFNSLKHGLLSLFFTIQLLFPWRYLAYPGELFWTEEGYRFSWRVMLMEKSGYAQFRIVDKDAEREFYVDNTVYLTPFQEKQMSFQPDFILEYAHFLAETYRAKGIKNIAVFVDCQVALNGRLSQTFIDPKTDLTQIRESFEHKFWILPFQDEIKGI